MNIEDVLKGHGIGVGGSNIKSIQRGSITPFNNTTATTATITISPINKNNSIVRVSFLHDGNYLKFTIPTIEITDTVTLTLTRSSNTTATTITYYWEVIEFNNVKSKQVGVETNGGGTITISPVNLNKSLLFNSMRINVSSSDASSATEYYYLANSTTINIRSASGLYNAWQVIEFN